jgi:hypothetical protein
VADWGWVALGFGAAYGAIGAYLAWLGHRVRAARRRLEELR